jgi:hypothetical protein
MICIQFKNFTPSARNTLTCICSLYNFLTSCICNSYSCSLISMKIIIIFEWYNKNLICIGCCFFTDITNHKVIIFDSEISGIWVCPTIYSSSYSLSICIISWYSCSSISPTSFRTILPTLSTFPCSCNKDFITTGRFHEWLSMRHKCTNKVAKMSFILYKTDFEYIPNSVTTIKICF